MGRSLTFTSSFSKKEKLEQNVIGLAIENKLGIVYKRRRYRGVGPKEEVSLV